MNCGTPVSTDRRRAARHRVRRPAERHAAGADGFQRPDQAIGEGLFDRAHVLRSDLGDLLAGHPAAQDGLPVRRQRVRLVGDEGPHEQQAFAETAERIDEFVDVAAQRRRVSPVEQFGQLVGHGVDR